MALARSCRRARPATIRTARLCSRAIGAVYVVAFASLWIQIHGLVGSRGILPVTAYLSRVREALGLGEAVRRLPTLLWINPSDTMLHLLCAAGMSGALVLLLGRGNRLFLLLAWSCYLSLTLGGQSFLQFQWDSLLLETGLVGLWLLPWWRPAARIETASGIVLLRALLCKLMFLSGIVKLLSFDDLWWELRALDVHYLTQPLPYWTSWYAHQLPPGLQSTSVLLMFVVELALPCLMFGPRPLRRIAFLGTVLFQLLIGATGNYGFFNLLTIVLCVALLDDEDLAAAPRLLPGRRRFPAAKPGGETERLLRRRFRRRLAWGSAALVLLLSLGTALIEIERTVPRPPRSPWGRAALSWVGAVGAPFRPVLALVRPLRSINGYGLFRSMTRERPEIGVEVSEDGREWRELAFRFKPGDPQRAPRWTAVHMPRLDWQMWFAALAPEREGWLGGLVSGLLEEREPVVRLLAPGTLREPPELVRLRMWLYRFSTPAERRSSGAWWMREDLGLLAGPFDRSSPTGSG